jgi:mannose-6-phosphate isomerase-like protein (cupin superfamily)
MQSFQLHELEDQATELGNPYFEFLRVPAMSMGLYRVGAGKPDLQSPNKQDEIYYVLSGKAKLEVNDKREVAIPGSILYVEAGAAHKFVEIQEDLEVLVFFAPSEKS